MIREPNFAGKFYAGNKEDLINQIEDSIKSKFGPGKISPLNVYLKQNIGIIVPHAGYQFSSPLQAWGYSSVAKIGRPKIVILIGPNHSGLGEDVSIYNKGKWKTPLGETEVNEFFANRIINESDGLIKSNFIAHEYEHSLEVQLPFLQYFFGNEFEIIPITILNQKKENIIKIANVLKHIFNDKDFLFVFSSDLNHYESKKRTYYKDELFINELTNKGDIYSICRKNDISVCGLGPIEIGCLLFNEVEILKHITSGDVINYDDQTVGYLSALFIDYK